MAPSEINVKTLRFPKKSLEVQNNFLTFAHAFNKDRNDEQGNTEQSNIYGLLC